MKELWCPNSTMLQKGDEWLRNLIPQILNPREICKKKEMQRIMQGVLF
jgi:hypothetical protein